MRFKSRIEQLKYERHLLTKYKRLEELRCKINQCGGIKSAREYMVIANSILGKDRIDSRRKIIMFKKI